MNAEQLTLLPEINEKEVQHIVIKELKQYRALKIQLENKKEQEKEGVVGIFPAMRKVERINEIKVRQVERALNKSLDFIEKKIVEIKYLSNYDITDIGVYLELGIKKDKYYKKKRSALNNLATALGII